MMRVSHHHITEPETQTSCSIAVHEIGDASKPVIFCVHGLTRNAKDFYPLAEQLAADYRVIMPDVPGRGQSEYLANPLLYNNCLLYTSPSPRDQRGSRMPSSA